MKRLSLFLLVAAACLPGLANAQVTAAQQVVIAAARMPLSFPAVLTEVGQRKAFQMSDGHTLVVEGRGRQLRVRHAGQPAHLLRPSGLGRFVSADQQVALLMTRDTQGETWVSFSYPAPAL